MNPTLRVTIMGGYQSVVGPILIWLFVDRVKGGENILWNTARPHPAAVLDRIPLCFEVEIGRRVGRHGHRMGEACSNLVNREFRTLKKTPSIAIDTSIPGAAPNPSTCKKGRSLGVHVQFPLGPCAPLMNGTKGFEGVEAFESSFRATEGTREHSKGVSVVEINGRHRAIDNHFGARLARHRLQRTERDEG